jgi:tetratricopeptide (TPR) repeat protein
VNHSVSDRECVRGAGSRLLRRGRLASCLSLALCVWLSPAVARSADSAAPPVTAAARKDDAETLKKARDLTRAGLERFESGDYDSAIAHFRAAYALLPAAKLLYNMAQAERLKGDMKSACENYRAFLALEPEGRLSALAREHCEQCLEAQPPPAPVSEVAAKCRHAKPRRARSSLLRRRHARTWRCRRSPRGANSIPSAPPARERS